MDEYVKTGYLYADFKLFYIRDSDIREFELHYHDFHKILIFLGGNVTYYVEGKTYSLSPNDIVLVKAGDIHRPVVYDNSCYERIIMYLSPGLFENEDMSPLYKCFEYAKRKKSNLLHMKDSHVAESFKMLFNQLICAARDEGELNALHQKLHIIDFLIHLNDYLLSQQDVFETNYISNKHVAGAINYINKHIVEPLTVQEIADSLYITPPYLMHIFKKETGCTLMNYIEKKRLFIADNLLRQGMSKTEACYLSGFKNYSAYYYARKKSGN